MVIRPIMTYFGFHKNPIIISFQSIFFLFNIQGRLGSCRNRPCYYFVIVRFFDSLRSLRMTEGRKVSVTGSHPC